MRSSDAGLNGVLPSKACSTMPSSTSPSVMSWYSAKAFSTLRIRFSMRTPVCTRSTSRLGPSFMCTNVPWYQLRIKRHDCRFVMGRTGRATNRGLRRGRGSAGAEVTVELALRVRRGTQHFAMLHTLHRLNFHVGLLMAGEADIGKDQHGLRAIGEVECAVEAERLHAPLFAAGFVESVGERDGFIVDLVGQVRRKHGNRQRHG